MTRKDYVKLAEALRITEANIRTGFLSTPDETWAFLRSHLIDVLQNDNPRFDVERFVAACYERMD